MRQTESHVMIGTLGSALAERLRHLPRYDPRYDANPRGKPLNHNVEYCNIENNILFLFNITAFHVMIQRFFSRIDIIT